MASASPAGHGYDHLYQQFHFDEPWDSPHNIQLLDEMPEEFRSRGLAPGGTNSAFRVITGEEAYHITYDPSGVETSRGPRIQSVTDGLQTSIAVVELMPDKAVPWTQWNEVEFNAADPLDGIGPIPADGLRVAMTNGAVHTLNPDATSENFGVFATWNDGESFGPAESNNVFLDWQYYDPVVDSHNKLRQMGIALYRYYDVFLNFPIEGSSSWWDVEAMHPHLSWRVYLLPYLGYEDLFDEFHKDEPWNSPHNIQLLHKMPEEFRSRGLANDSHLTGFKLFEGDEAYSYNTSGSEPYQWRGPSLFDIQDSTGNTIAVIELMADQAVEWTRPDGNIMFDPNDPLAGVGSIPEDGLRVLMFDGSTHTINPNVTAENLKTFVTFSGAEVFGFAESSNAFLDWQRPSVDDPLNQYDEDLSWRSINMRGVGIALHEYHDIYLHFPFELGNYLETPHYDPETELPYLSWRVHLLPYLGHSALYYQFHLDEPWDSPHNIELLDKMPEVFRSRGLGLDSTKTGLQLFIGEGAYEYHYSHNSSASGLRLRNITDGTSNTIAVIETMPEDAVEWTRPDGDIAWDASDPYGGLTIPPDLFLTLQFDGSVVARHPLLDEDTFRSLVTIAAGD